MLRPYLRFCYGRPPQRPSKIDCSPRDKPLHAPHLIDVEVAQVIRRYAANGDIDDERGRMALADLADFPLRRYPHDFLLPRVWALRNNLTAYDATYVALAEVLDMPLLTRDRRLAGAAGHQARVEFL
jgi:predicted nucleic acid-binding protein